MGAKIFKSIKNGTLAELVGNNDHGVVLLLQNGEERILAPSTFKRWWKETQVETPKTTAPTPTGNMQENFILAANKMAELVGAELFVRPNTKNYNFRKEGVIYLWFTVTKTGVTLYAKSKAIGTKYPHIKVNHNFDVKIQIDKWNTEVYNTIREIHDLSLDYQLSRKQAK